MYESPIHKSSPRAGSMAVKQAADGHKTKENGQKRSEGLKKFGLFLDSERVKSSQVKSSLN